MRLNSASATTAADPESKTIAKPVKRHPRRHLQDEQEHAEVEADPIEFREGVGVVRRPERRQEREQRERRQQDDDDCPRS